MSLFKVNRGNEANLPTTLTDGWAYFCTDTGSFLIDHYDSTNTLVRSKISAEYTDKIRYVQNEEPTDVPDGTLWLDMDAEGSAEGGGGSESIFVDTTLTQAGQAADAKAVGDKIKQINESIAGIKPEVDLSNYYTKEETNTLVNNFITNEEIDTICGTVIEDANSSEVKF